eukprot:2896397-Amphidinium_carterae.4
MTYRSHLIPATADDMVSAAYRTSEAFASAEAKPASSQAMPVYDQQGNRRYDLNSLLGVTVTVAATKNTTERSSSSSQARQPVSALALQSSPVTHSEHVTHQRWTVTNGEDQPSEFSLHSTQETLDEHDVLYVFNDNTLPVPDSKESQTWFSADGPLREPRCCICLAEMVKLRPCIRCNPDDPCHLCDQCASRTELCLCCSTEAVEAAAAPSSSTDRPKNIQKANRRTDTPKCSQESRIARLRRDEGEHSDPSDDEMRSGHEYRLYPVFMDDVQPGTAYASTHGHVKPSHDKATSKRHPATLLPDTGAVENLIGSRRAAEFHKEATRQGMSTSWSRLKTPKLVSGVGGSAQLIQHQLTVEGRIAAHITIQYTAPVIERESSGVPALLGLREQARARCVILPNLKELKILPPHASEAQISWPAGTKTIALEQAASGHLLVPFLQSMTKFDEARRDTNHPSHKYYQLEPESSYISRE